jgi:hypothetical protein
MKSPGVAVLSASFDPGWRLTVDGSPGSSFVAAPALIATTLPAGTHRIVYTYIGFASYPSLFALSGLTLAALLVTDISRRRRKRPDPVRGSSATGKQVQPSGVE